MNKTFVIGVLAALALTGPVRAQTVEQDGVQDEYSVDSERAQDVFLKYYKSVRAESDCRQVVFSPDDQLAMDKAIAQEMVSRSPDVSLGAARLLNLRRMADDGMDKLVGREGCDGQMVKKALAFYDERLAKFHTVVTVPAQAAQPAEQPLPDQAAAVQDGSADTPAAPPSDALRPQGDAAPQSLVPAPQP